MVKTPPFRHGLAVTKLEGAFEMRGRLPAAEVGDGAHHLRWKQQQALDFREAPVHDRRMDAFAEAGAERQFHEMTREPQGRCDGRAGEARIQRMMVDVGLDAVRNRYGRLVGRRR